MKKVRFETPIRGIYNKMDELECHSPRPFTEKQIVAATPDLYSCVTVLPFNNDPVQKFDSTDSFPYPTMNKTRLTDLENVPSWSPCNDLELSMFDATNFQPQHPSACRSILKLSGTENNNTATNAISKFPQNKCSILSSIENKMKPPNVSKKDDFFLRRGNIDNLYGDINSVQHQIDQLSLNKENNPLVIRPDKKVEVMGFTELTNNGLPCNPSFSSCRCHHCCKITTVNKNPVPIKSNCSPEFIGCVNHQLNNCKCSLPQRSVRCPCCDHSHVQHLNQTCDGNFILEQKVNTVENKTLSIERYEKSKNTDLMSVETHTNISKEKREPTVSDLFKIIKLQNEQLQLLQEKVDKFISVSQQTSSIQTPIQNCMSEQLALNNIENEQHKISIGVMTSFEMVRTSTIINKEIIKNKENAQLQCNRSEISIKEVLSTSQSPPTNFLDGIHPIGRPITKEQEHNDDNRLNTGTQQQNEEKTLNEMSLYNVQVDNAITPLMSPDQSLYLDVRDYSDSDAENDDQSNVGWTYYNKVMTHVNGVLQDSDMPSSASALYRNTRQHLQTVQMQIDKTNVSVTKRVKFGDDPLGIRQSHIYTASTDTSLKMNQLAAKYLKSAHPVSTEDRMTVKPITHHDMSFATRNYMERHKLLQSYVPLSKTPSEIPRFLDITALKQQPKFL